MARKKKAPRPTTRLDRVFGMIGGVLAGALISLLLVALSTGKLPYPGALGIVAAALPGIPFGALLGWLYPRPFTMIADGIFTGL